MAPTLVRTFPFSVFNENRICSSPEPLGSQGELIVYPCPGVRPSSSGVRRLPFSKMISKTAGLIKVKFHLEPP